MKFFKSPVSWIPSLYFAEGFPNVIVSVIAAVMYKRLSMSGEVPELDNTEIALYVSWMYLPWVIKPFWSPIVDVLKSKRWWILAMQFLMGTAFAGVAFAIPTSSVIQWTLVLFWLVAYSSATHDIAADGYYMHQLNTHEQTLYVGFRSLFYRLSTIAGQGLLLMLVGNLEVFLRNSTQAWSITFFCTAALFFLLWLYHRWVLPKPRTDRDEQQRFTLLETIKETLAMVIAFLLKPGLGVALFFMLFYRFPEALLTRICPLFMLDSQNVGGLALSTSQMAYVQGTLGVVGLILGGILGGIVVSQSGFKKWLWPMVFSISLPNAIYIFFAYWQPVELYPIAIGVFIEQFGYGFGFTAYMLYQLYFSQMKFTIPQEGIKAKIFHFLLQNWPGLSHYLKKEFQTSHYAFCTGLMAVGLMVPGSLAGWIQAQMGYLNFFILILLLCPITFIVSAIIRVPASFGCKEDLVEKI